MAEYLIQSATLREIANAIRAQTGSTALISVSDMAEKIRTITGSSSDRLEAPAVSLSGNIITVSPVANADSYVLYILSLDGMAMGTVAGVLRSGDEMAFHLDEEISSYGVYTLAVKAVNIAGAYAESGYGNAVVWEKPGTPAASAGLPAEISTEAEMNAILSQATSDDVGKIYKYIGTTTNTYKNNELYVIAT